MNLEPSRAAPSGRPVTPLTELHRAEACVARARMRRNGRRGFVQAVRKARDHLNYALTLFEELLDRGTAPYVPSWVVGSPNSEPTKPEAVRYGKCPTCGQTLWTNEIKSEHDGTGAPRLDGTPSCSSPSELPVEADRAEARIPV